jgi:serine/threonine-protein kinase RsbW
LEHKNYNIEIPSDPNNLITVEEFVHYFGKELNIEEDKLQNLLLSVTEATTNAIMHANKCDLDKKVIIDVTDTGDKLIVKIIDEGKGFDPAKVPDPTNPENLLKDSGRGIYLMRFYMDEVTYNITSKGTETILVLYK